MQTSHDFQITQGSTSRKRSNLQMRALAARHRRDEQEGLGVRIDLEWSRARQFEKARSNRDLISALEWSHVRRGIEWTRNDAVTLRDIVDRSWSVREMQGLGFVGLPPWIREMVPKRRSEAYCVLLASIISAYRSGACGLIASQTALAGQLQTTSATVRRWTAELEALGLIRIVQTWQPDPKGGRMYGPLHYRVGYKLEVDATLAGAPVSSDRSSEAARYRKDAAERRKATKASQRRRIRDAFAMRSADRDDDSRCRPLSDAWAKIEDIADPLHLKHDQNVPPLPPPHVGGNSTTPPDGGVELERKPAAPARRVVVRYVPTPAGVARASDRPRQPKHSPPKTRAGFAGASGQVECPRPAVAKPEPAISSEERQKICEMLSAKTGELLEQMPDGAREAILIRRKLERENRRIEEMSTAEHRRKTEELRRKFLEPVGSQKKFFADEQGSKSVIFDIIERQKNFFSSLPSGQSVIFDKKSPDENVPIEDLKAGRSYLAGLTMPKFKKE